MKVLVTGADGQLGKALMRCKSEKYEICGYTQAMCNVTDAARVYKIIGKEKPGIVIHCAAYTAVDRAETEPEICRAVNVEGTKHVLAACKQFDTAFMLLSTDYVFSGEGTEPYHVDEAPKPLNQYGISKMQAELLTTQWEKHYIVRTSWMFGEGSNFVKTICALAQKKNTISVVADQIGSPTYAEDLAPMLLRLASGKPYGIYHVTNEGFCSWAEFAQYIVHTKGLPAQIQSVTSEEYSSKAVRPHNSRLSKNCLTSVGLQRLPPWQDAVTRYLHEMGEI